MNDHIPEPPDIVTHWREQVLVALQAAGVDADVGVKRPAAVENLSRPFVRLVQIGGPWRWFQFWFPRLLTETYAPSAQGAHRIDAVVARTTARLAGHGGRPYQPPGWYVTESKLDNQGADSNIDGVPVVITQALLCVQVWPLPNQEG